MSNPFAGSKIYHHPDRVHEWLHMGDTVPVCAEIDLTNRCTDRCPCCAGGRERNAAELDTKTAMRVVEELADMGCKALTFTGGGEPLCHPDAYKVMKHAYAFGMEIALITNGTLLDAEQHWDALKLCTWIRVSLDADGPEMHRHTHGVDTYERVIRNIRQLVAKRGDCTAPTIGVGYLVGRDTVKGMLGAAQLGAQLGVDYTQFRPFHEATNDPTVPTLALEQYSAAQAHSTDTHSVVWSERKFREMLKSGGNPERPYKKCYGHSFTTVIGADGEVYLCCHMRGMPEYSYGSIYTKSLHEIWASKQRWAAVRAIDFKKCPPICRCDTFNAILWNMRHKKPTHINFL